MKQNKSRGRRKGGDRPPWLRRLWCRLSSLRPSKKGDIEIIPHPSDEGEHSTNHQNNQPEDNGQPAEEPAEERGEGQ